MTLWKASERQIAAILSGRRIPVSGRGDGPDVDHPQLAIEVKQRRTLPDWLHHAMGQAERAAVPGQTPVAILHQKGQRYADAYCVMRLGDLVRLLEDRA